MAPAPPPKRFLIGFVVALVVWLCVPQVTHAEETRAPANARAEAGVSNPALVDSTHGLTWVWRRGADGEVTELVSPGAITTHVTRASIEAAADGTRSCKIESGTEMRSYTQDKDGRLLRAEGTGGKVVFRYDKAGRPLEVVAEGSPALRYTHDVLGRLIQLRIGDSTVVRYRYDYLGRLAAIAMPGGGEIVYEYQLGANMIIRRLPNGTQTAWQTDDEGRLVKITHIDSKNYVIAEYEYVYRPDGLLEGAIETNRRSGKRVLQYEYDLMQRLSGVACRGEGLSYRYAYDPLGNLTEVQPTGGAALRFTSAPTGMLATDSRGSCRTDRRGHIRRLPGLAGSVDYDFNSAGELVAAKSGSPTYVYNALGLLTTRSADGRTTRYLPDPFAGGWRPLWQRNAEGVEAVIVWADAFPLAELSDKNVLYRLEDRLGSVRAEIDGKGQVIAWYDYEPYGAPTVPEPVTAPRFGFAGLLWDPAARVYLAMARAYDPVTARFLQPDPWLRPPGVSKLSHSLYAYCGGDPVNWVDVNGALPQDPNQVWRNTFWEDIRRNLLNADRANQIYAEWSARELARAQHVPSVRWSPLSAPSSAAFELASAQHGVGVAATRATFFDLVAGYNILGKPATENQGLAQLAWSLGPMGAARLARAAQLPRVATALGGIGFGRTTVSAVDNASKGNFGRAALDLTSMSLFELGEVSARVIPKAGQYVFPFSIADAGRNVGIKTLAAAPAAKDAFGWGKLASSGFQHAERWSPSSVGGVYLGGAGKVLEGMGRLKGVAVDATTGQLILIGADEKLTALPPLRLEDVVTVFRAVFDYGESPSVTIDPDGTNPMGPIMRVKHGPGTTGTYVGWILFECDRIMKTYQFGKDNVTGKELGSKITGYGDMIDAVFFGDRTHEQAVVNGMDPKRTPESRWERFWIVPATVQRFDAGVAGDLSLFELPLKVNTQQMQWNKGRLVDDEKAESSVGARAFTRWFTEHYDDVADEVRLAPPPDSGIKEPVAIFRELRRIALITAIAERLREQGTKMPVWMRDYPVASFPVAETTPSLTMEKKRSDSNTMRIASMYGGVNLAPADKDVHAYGDTKAAPVPKEDLPFVELSRKEAIVLASKIPELAKANRDDCEPQSVAQPGGTVLTAAVLPGAASRALSPNRQTVSDMEVPVGLGHTISLTRHYNSFFDPDGECGKGWTFDLPVLLLTHVPVTRTGKQAEYRLVPHLISPLGSIDILFDKRAIVDPWKVEMAVAGKHPEVAGVTAGSCDIVGATTHQVLFRDGSSWHFDDAGRLLVEQSMGMATRYIRDADGRIRQIVGYVGKRVLADIRLSHDSKGRIVKAEANQADDLSRQAPATAVEVRFEYGAGGRLVGVTRLGGKEGASRRSESKYAYEDRCLVKMGDADGSEISFGYNTRGQMLWELQGGLKRNYTMATTEHGAVLSSHAGADGGEVEKWTYDARMRPVSAELGDGQEAKWRYGVDKEVSVSLSQGGKTVLTRSASPDGRTETISFADGSECELRRDASARPESVTRDGTVVAQLDWRPDGVLERVRTVNMEMLPRHNVEGWQSGVVLREPQQEGEKCQWTEEEWDLLARPSKLTDSSGYEYAMNYDEVGRLKTLGRPTKDGKLSGSLLSYDGKDRITGIDSSWQKEKREYAAEGALIRCEIERQGKTATTAFDALERMTSHVAFDGGRTSWRYKRGDGDATPQMVELPNGESIRFERGKPSEMTETIRLGPAVVVLQDDAQGRISTFAWSSQTP